MSMKFNTTLPSPTELKEEYPLSEKLAELKKKRDQEIRDIFTGKSDKFAVIIGPCSADNEDSVCEYVNRLAKVNEKVKDALKEYVDFYMSLYFIILLVFFLIELLNCFFNFLHPSLSSSDIS